MIKAFLCNAKMQCCYAATGLFKGILRDYLQLIEQQKSAMKGVDHEPETNNP